MTVRRSDPDTSKQAARAIQPHLGPLQRSVLRFAKAMGSKGFDDLQLRETFGGEGSTYRSRRSELRDKGYITDTGRRVRANPNSNRLYIVWAITPKGAVAEI